MEKKEGTNSDQETSAQATVDRGKKAIEAEKKSNNRDAQSPEVQKEEKEDAEKWRNEG
jgi:hypothetical protein